MDEFAVKLAALDAELKGFRDLLAEVRANRDELRHNRDELLRKASDRSATAVVAAASRLTVDNSTCLTQRYWTS